MPGVFVSGENDNGTGFGNSTGSQLMSAWSDAAPMLSSKLLYQFANAGISPADPVGQWVISTGVPVLGSNRGMSGGTTEGLAAANMLSNPGLLSQIKNLPMDKQEAIFKMSAAQVGALDPTKQQQLATTGRIPVSHGWLNQLGDWLTTGARETFAGLQSGANFVSAAYRSRVAQGSMDPTATGVKATAEGKPQTAASQDLANRYGTTIETPFGGKITFGNVQETSSFQGLLNQNIEYQHLVKGKDLGSGIFPGGEAQKATVTAQQAAANINGHALTPGRALASTVTQPGTFPYNVVSGVVDAQVAMHADPAAAVLHEVSDAASAARMFAPSGEAARVSAAKYIVGAANDSNKVTAIREWTGATSADEPNLVRAVADKLRTDPGGLQALAGQNGFTNEDVLSAIGRDHVGLVDGLRKAVSPKDTLTWLNGPASDRWAEAARSGGFLDNLKLLGKNGDVRVAAQLADASTPQEAKQILGQAIGSMQFGVPSGVMPYMWSRPLQDTRLYQYVTDQSHRLFGVMPNGYMDVNDIQDSVMKARQMLTQAKVPSAFQDDLLADMAKSQNGTDFYNAYKRVAGAIEDTLKTRGVDPDHARALTRFAGAETQEAKTRFATEVGSTPHISGLSVDGEPVPIVGPHLPSEFLNQGLPVLDMRKINRNVGLWGKAWNDPIVGGWIQGSTHTADWITNAFKAGVHARPALAVRIAADVQARQAAAGLPSIFDHPIGFVTALLGKDLNPTLDVNGKPLIEQLGDAKSEISRAVGVTSGVKKDIFSADQMLSKDYVNFQTEDPQFLRAWSDELSHLHMDLMGREVARAMRDVNYAPADVRDVEGLGGLDAIKQAGWVDGPIQDTRNSLADAMLWDGQSAAVRTSPEAWNAYVDSVAQRIQLATNGHPELLDAVADGNPFSLSKTWRGGNTSVVDPDFKALLGDLRASGEAPNVIRGAKELSQVHDPKLLKNVLNFYFTALMDTPTKRLGASPAFQNFYSQKFDDMQPWIKDGTVTAEQADTIAKGHALNETKKLLYQPGSKLNIEDKLRNIMPFAPIWRNVVTTWAKLGAENPAILRRAQQAYTAAQQGGFITHSDQLGTDVMNLVPSDVMKHLSGVPFPLVAPVQGMNIVGQGMPGVGPVVQMPADMLLPKNGVFDSLRQQLEPYGSPDYSGGFFESLFPGWMDKLRASGWLLQHLPGTPRSIPFLTPTQTDRRLMQSLTNNVVSYEMSTGHYDISQPGVKEKLIKRAQTEAQKLYLLRSMGQFAAPAAPQVENKIQGTDGTLLETWKLSQDFYAMEKLYGNTNDAVMAFLNKYPKNYIFATEPMSRRLPNAIPTTSEAEIWRGQNQDFANAYPDVYAYWAPQEGAFSYQTYLDQINRGELQPLKTSDWMSLAEARIGNAAYSKLRAAAGASPSQRARNILDQAKQYLTQQYPGFNQDALKLNYNTLDQTVPQLVSAASDPKMRNNPLSQAILGYVEARQQVLKVAQARSGSAGAGLAGKDRADLRAALYQLGTRIATATPAFQNIWNDLFLSEVEPPQEA